MKAPVIDTSKPVRRAGESKLAADTAVRVKHEEPAGLDEGPAGSN
jgi:hypothetical protein